MDITKIDKEAFLKRANDMIEKAKERMEKAALFSLSDDFISIVKACKHNDDYEGILKEHGTDLNNFSAALRLYNGEFFEGEYAIEDDWDSVLFKKIDGVIFKCDGSNGYFLLPQDEDFDLHLDRINMIKSMNNIAFALISFSEDEKFLANLTPIEKTYLLSEVSSLKNRRQYMDKKILFISDMDVEAEEFYSENWSERLKSWIPKIMDHMAEKNK